MKLTTKKLLTISILSALISGCSGLGNKSANIEIDKNIATADLQLNAVAKSDYVTPQDVTQSNDIWLPTMVSEKRKQLDPRLSASFSINKTLRSINEGAGVIITLTGLPVYISEDITNQDDEGLSESVVAGVDPMTGLLLPPEGSSEDMTAAYSGTLAGFLDVFASHYNVSWSFNEGKINFYKYETRMFIIKTVPGNTTSISDIKSSGDSDSLTTKVDTSELNIWQDISSAVGGMISSGGSVVVSPAIGTLTVTDTPTKLGLIAEYIKNQNSHLKMQAAINLRVLSVALNDEEAYDINWDLVNENIKQSLGLGVSSGNPLSVTSAAITLKKLVTGTLLQDGQRSSSGSDLQGTSLLIQALSKQGRVSSMTNLTEMTLNNQPAPIHVGRSIAYLESSTTTPSVTPGIAPTTELVPGVVSTGFTMNILPHIQDKDNMILQYALDISSLLSLDSISSGGSTIQTPETDVKRMMQRVFVRSGETIVLAGFENNEIKTAARGGSKPNSSWLSSLLNGVGESSQEDRTRLVILVTPIIMTNE